MSHPPSEAPSPQTYPVVGQFPPPHTGPAPHHPPPYVLSGDQQEEASPSRFVPYRPPLSAEEEKQQLALRYQQEQDQEERQQQQQQDPLHHEPSLPPVPPPEQHAEEAPPRYEAISPSAQEPQGLTQHGYPPPPPHPPKESRNENLQRTPSPKFPPPPTKEQDDQHQYEQHHQQQQQQPVHEGYLPPPGEPTQSPLKDEQQYYPPPPPLPHPPSLSQETHESEHHPPAYAIPAYDPANPVFAFPPTHLQTDHEPPSGQGNHNIQGQQHYSEYQHHDEHQSPSPSSAHGHHGQSTPHDRPKHSWSERFSQLSVKAAAPINSIAHKLGSQSFLPETLDKECDKAAAILKAFCKKGVYAEPDPSDSPDVPSPSANATEKRHDAGNPARAKPKNRVLVTIPPKVISKAVGLAIFTTLRAGYGLSGATGSGILVARLPDGGWSPPSGIQLHSVGGGFQIGVDIYDCVCVINSQKALEAFMDTRVSLGSDLAVVAGPYGAGAAVEIGAAMQDLDKKNGKTGGATPTKKFEPPPEAETTPQQEYRQEHQQSQQGKQSTLPSANETQGDRKKDARRGVPNSATKPVFSYVKSRGFYAGISIDGTVVAERKDANAAFYGQAISVQHILRGHVPYQGPAGMWPAGAQELLAVLRGAEAGAPPPQQQQQQQDPVATCERESDEQGAPPPAYADDGRQRFDSDVKYK